MSFREVDWEGIVEDAADRPWPVPDRPWVMRMSWVDLLFAHWRVEPELLERTLPEGLLLDRFEGEAWVGLVPFTMDHVGVRRWPSPAPWSRFCELNVRTYVLTPDGVPGVWFYSLDAASRGAVEGARSAFGLPYYLAQMRSERAGERVDYSSRRDDPRLGPGVFRARWEPSSEVRRAAEGTLERWLTERYCLYSHHRGRLRRAEVRHAPWPLRDARAVITENSVCAAHGLRLLGDAHAPLLHCVDRVDVVGWWTSPV